MAGKVGTVERKLARIAERAHGVATRAELLQAGVTEAELEQRLRNGLLLPVHRGVYRVGHAAPGVEATYMAAVRACGPDALLSGRAAGHAHGLLRGASPPPEVSAPVKRRVPGVTTRRTRRLDPGDREQWRGIGVTSVPRTLVDLAAVLPAWELARACHEADVRHRVGPEQIEEALARWPNSPGSRALRAVLRGETRVSLSVLERRFLALLREAALPLPETNRVAGGRRVDCRWPDRRLTVELDGYRFHRSRHAWEQDRRREREAYARGDELRRYTHADVRERPAAMLRELRGLLRG